LACSSRAGGCRAAPQQRQAAAAASSPRRTGWRRWSARLAPGQGWALHHAGSRLLGALSVLMPPGSCCRLPRACAAACAPVLLVPRRPGAGAPGNLPEQASQPASQPVRSKHEMGLNSPGGGTTRAAAPAAPCSHNGAPAGAARATPRRAWHRSPAHPAPPGPRIAGGQLPVLRQGVRLPRHEQRRAALPGQGRRVHLLRRAGGRRAAAGACQGLPLWRSCHNQHHHPLHRPGLNSCRQLRATPPTPISRLAHTHNRAPASHRWL
jgi:hypothetical protein